MVTRQRVLVLGAVVVIAFAFAAKSRFSRSRPMPSSSLEDGGLPKPHRVVHVPHLNGPLVLDGELDEAAWHSTPVTKLLKPDGTEGRPYADVRFLWSSDGIFHVGLYASDRDIVSAGVGPDGPVWKGDAFHTVFSSSDGVEHSFDVGITSDGGVLTDGERKAKGAWSYAWQSGARLACDMDEGTADNPNDADEEWVVEMEIPMAALGLRPEPGQRIDFVARRCDVNVRGGPPLEIPCPETDVLELVFEP